MNIFLSFLSSVKLKNFYDLVDYCENYKWVCNENVCKSGFLLLELILLIRVCFTYIWDRCIIIDPNAYFLWNLLVVTLIAPLVSHFITMSRSHDQELTLRRNVLLQKRYVHKLYTILTVLSCALTRMRTYTCTCVAVMNGWNSINYSKLYIMHNLNNCQMKQFTHQIKIYQYPITRNIWMSWYERYLSNCNHNVNMPMHSHSINHNYWHMIRQLSINNVIRFHLSSKFGRTDIGVDHAAVAGIVNFIALFLLLQKTVCTTLTKTKLIHTMMLD